MNGQGSWFSIAVFLVAISPLVALWLTGWSADRHYRVEQRRVRCRVNGNQLVQCTVVRDARTDEPIGIRACSAKPNPEDVRCARTCLPLFAHTA
ncbi:MAG TPA: hypothetical protein VMK66_15855 [Myxococcales bacterium]|nr:hypothetical protein [Myxococcales bacterium]